MNKFSDTKNELQEELVQLESERRVGRDQLEKIKRDAMEQEELHKHNMEQREREVDLANKRIAGEKERLSILKAEVDGEDTHLKELRKVAEAEFGSLQKNVQDLAKKANEVKDDINSKRLVVERLRDKIKHLEEVKEQGQVDHDELSLRQEKELSRLRLEIGRTEVQLSDIREEVSNRRAREDERIETYKSELHKVEARVENAREDYKIEKRGQDEKRKRFQSEIEDLKKEFKERQGTLDSLRAEIEDGNRRLLQTTRSVNDIAHRVTELNSTIETKSDELKVLLHRKENLDAEIEGQLVQMENAVHQGKIVAEKLKADR